MKRSLIILIAIGLIGLIAIAHPDKSYHPVQPGQEPISEDNAKEVAKAFLTTYLPEYVIDKIEQSETCPAYLVTVRGFFYDAVLQVKIDVYTGNIPGIIVPLPPAEESTDATTSATW
jgi:hypothetical protein